MRPPESRARLRRSLVIAISGVAVWLVGVVLAVGGPASSTQLQSGLFSTTSDLLRSWIRTPGVGPYEAIAYLGLALALGGPVGYWLLRALRDRRAAAIDEPEFFEYDHAESDGPAEASASDTHRPIPASPTLDDASSPNWVDRVFDEATTTPSHRSNEAFTGDFYRSVGNTNHASHDLRGVADGGGRLEQAASRVDLLGAIEVDDETEATPQTCPPAPPDHPGDAATAPATDETSRGPGEPEPTDTLESLAESLAEQQAGLATVSERLDRASTTSIEAANAFAELNGDDPVEPLVDSLTDSQTELASVSAALAAATADSAPGELLDRGRHQH